VTRNASGGPSCASAARPWWSRLPGAVGRHLRTVKAAKYLTSSIVATAAGQLTFLVVYGLGLADARVTTLVAFVAAAVPNYWLNRRWAWSRRGRPEVLRELVPYVATIAVNLAVATVTTHYAETHVTGLTDSHVVRVVVVTLTYASTYAVLFLGKYLVFEYVIFGDRAYARHVGRTPPAPPSSGAAVGPAHSRDTDEPPSAG